MNQFPREVYIFIGRSGCGKGTQAKLLTDYLHQRETRQGSNRKVLYLETGQRFRDFINQGSYSSSLSRAVMEKSERQPSFLAIWTWADILVNALTGDEVLLFDGTPRSLVEAEALDTALTFYGFTKKYVVHLDVARDWSANNLLARGRKDDTVNDINKRLDWFDRDVTPAINYYRDHADYQLLEINGQRGIDEVSADILAHLE